MFKTIAFGLNLIVLIALKFIFGGEVSVTQNFPAEVKEGESFLMEVVLEKGDREGFAKWQQKLPNGFVASPKETAGATFSFKNQEVKLIWMALPKTETVSISYEVSIEPSLIGEFELEGKFSFIEENERKDISSGAQKILVGMSSDELLAKQESPEENQIEDEEPAIDEKTESIEPETEAVAAVVPVLESENLQVEETKEVEPVSETTEAKEPKEGLVLLTDQIKVSRDLTHIENGEYLVKLKIEKGSTTSFGKIEEYLPEDFRAEIIEQENGIVTFNNRVLKVMWMTLPEQATLNLEYRLISETDLFDSTEVHGVFSYLRDDRTTQLEMEATHFKNFYVDPDAGLAEESPEEKAPTESPTETTSIAAAIPESKTDKVMEEAAPEKTESIEAAVSSIPAPETSIAFRVQIAAGKKEVKADYFLKKYKLQDQVNIEYHETWYKYTLNPHPEYKMARDHRNNLWNRGKDFDDAFVSAYNAGERITVQEALMISKQKWLK